MKAAALERALAGVFSEFPGLAARMFPHDADPAAAAIRMAMERGLLDYASESLETVWPFDIDNPLFRELAKACPGGPAFAPAIPQRAFLAGSVLLDCVACGEFGKEKRRELWIGEEGDIFPILLTRVSFIQGISIRSRSRTLPESLDVLSGNGFLPEIPGWRL